MKNYPIHIAKPFKAYEKAVSESDMHKSLLDLGESLLTYIVGIMFGEYKKSGVVSEKLESEFYKFSNRKPSLGVFLSFMRLLSKEMNDTILSDKFQKNKKYTLVSDFVYEFEILKKVINEGNDDDFYNLMEDIRKGHSVAQKGLLDFYDSFIIIRNIYAHPEDKAGPKNQKRKWPLTEEYYSTINPYIYTAIMEIIEDFDVIKSYKPILAKVLDDQSKKGKFEIEIGSKGKEIELALSNEELRQINTDVRYLLDDDDKFFVKFYYSKIPQLNPEVAKKIINKQKAKEMEPLLLDNIHSKLYDDHKIDEMEYLILRDTAKTSSISIEHLFKLIEKKRNELKIDGTVGTPDNKGSIFVENKDSDVKISFNPWWLHYLSMVPKIDKKTINSEKKKKNQLTIKIDKLKKQKQNLFITKQLNNAKKKVKDKRAQKSKQLKSLNKQIQKKRMMIVKAKDSERKSILRLEINDIKNTINDKRLFFDTQIEELINSFNLINQQKDQKTTEIDLKISDLNNQLNNDLTFSQWGMHKNIWDEISQYVDHLLEINLNQTVESREDSDEESRSQVWANVTNAWQIGSLAYTYWAKIHPAESPLGLAYNVGYAVTSKFKWLPNNIDESLKEVLKKPVSLIWSTQDDQQAAKIDLDQKLQKKRFQLEEEVLKDYEKELIDMGANVKCVPHDVKNEDINDKTVHFMPLKKFLQMKNEYRLVCLYSRIWPVDSFYDGGKVLFDVVARYEKEMVTMLQLLSNVIVRLNDYALENDINKETINERFDQYNRLKNIMFSEFENKYPSGTYFKPHNEELQQWRNFAFKELDIRDDYLYDMILSRFRFESNSKVKDLSK